MPIENITYNLTRTKVVKSVAKINWENHFRHYWLKTKVSQIIKFKQILQSTVCIWEFVNVQICLQLAWLVFLIQKLQQKKHHDYKISMGKKKIIWWRTMTVFWSEITAVFSSGVFVNFPSINNKLQWCFVLFFVYCKHEKCDDAADFQ